MTELRRVVAWAAVLCGAVPTGAWAEPLRTQIFGTELTATGAVSLQGAHFEDPETGEDDEDGEWDGYVILNAERITSGGLVLGLRGEFDTGNRQAEELERDEIYLYVAGGFGRFELGEQDGPADTISHHAPVLGLGQIRGDFVRYAGTPALLSPVDTQDSLKAIYLSPPLRGFRFGVSYAPEFELNEGDPNPRRRTIQENAVETAIAYQTSFGGWAGGLSAAYVVGEAAPETERGDLNSWSIGLDFRRDAFSLGGAYVSRGESNSLTDDLDEEETNVGVAWRAENWGVGLSAAQITSRTFDNDLVGVGGYYEIGKYWVVRADYIYMDEQRNAGPSQNGHVALAEIAFVF